MENAPGSAASQQPRTYCGFISYSHRDSGLVRRLHRELEQYRVPQRLVGKPSPVTGVIPRRLQPIFLDREERYNTRRTRTRPLSTSLASATSAGVDT